MNDRDNQFRELAEERVRLECELEQATGDMNRAQTRLAAVKANIEKINEKLSDHTGHNIRRMQTLINGKLVRVIFEPSYCQTTKGEDGVASIIKQIPAKKTVTVEDLI